MLKSCLPIESNRMMEQRKNDMMMRTTTNNEHTHFISEERNHKNNRYKQIQGQPHEESNQQS